MTDPSQQPERDEGQGWLDDDALVPAPPRSDRAEIPESALEDDWLAELPPPRYDLEPAPRPKPERTARPARVRPLGKTLYGLALPAASYKEGDPWAHRRGEPRTLVLLWTVYLFVGALITVFSVRMLGPMQAGLFRPTTRMFLVIAAVGLTVLWPMVRLSQESPRRPLRATLVDAAALLLPAQAVIWPTKVLTHWGWDVVGGVSLLLISWTALVAAIVAMGVARRPGPARTWWMLLCLVFVAGAPVYLMLQALTGAVPRAELWLGSPITALFLLTDAPSGLTPAMAPEEWIAVLAPLVAAAALWLATALAGPESEPVEKGAPARA